MTIKSIKSSFKNFEEKKAFLDDLFYNVGKQKSDFRIFYMNEEKAIRTKWRTWKDVGFDVENKENKRFVEIANNRTQLSNEVELDVDLEKKDRFKTIGEKFKWVMEQLKEDGMYYGVFRTGSRGYHIRLIYDQALTYEEKIEIIERYGCETLKASEDTPVALEFVPHWKTGKNKELILENKGINKYVKKELTEEEQLEILRENCLSFEYDKEGNLRKVKVLIPKITEYLLSQYNFKTIFGSRSEDIFVYQDGIYIKSGREIIQTQTERILGEHCSNHYISEIVEKIKRLTAISREEFDNIPEEIICLENGILNLKTQRFSKHDPKYYFKVKLPIEHNSEAKCPKIKKFFEGTLYPDDVKVMQEWFGFCLYRRYFIKKAMILFGETDTCKTVMLDLLSRWLGEKNISGLSLQRISSGDKFRLVALENKYANVFDDLSSEDMISGGFKIATGGGNITAEHKFGDQFLFRTYAKLIFAGNKIPAIKEIDSEDSAYYDRWIPIPFDNQIPKKIQDKFFINEITTKKELSGLLNYALEGLKRILKNNGFSYKKDWKEIKQIIERHSNSISAFCQDVLVEKPGNKISKEDMYEIYCAYLKTKTDSGFTRFSKEQLGRQLPKYAKYILAKGGKKRIWENVDITDSHVNDDAFDTFIKIYSRNLKKDSHSIDMFSKKVSKVSNLNNFKSLENIDNLAIMKEEKQTAINLKKGKEYKASILGDDAEKLLKILLDDKKIKVLEKKKEKGGAKEKEK